MIPGRSEISKVAIGWGKVGVVLSYATPSIVGTRGITYRCTLIETGFTDLIVPASIVAIRFRQSPLRCYVSVIVPGIVDLIDSIQDRADGEIKIEQLQGSTAVELITANIEEFRYDQGANNRTGTIVGYKTITHSAFLVDVQDVTYKRVSGATMSFRGPPIHVLKPTCEAVVDSTQRTVDTVVWNVSESGSRMEFTTSG